MAATINGNDKANTLYQDDYGPDLTIRTYGGDDRVYLNLGGFNGGNNFVNTGTGDDRVINSFEGDNDIVLGTGNDYYAGNGLSSEGDFYDVVSGGAGEDTFRVRTSHSDYYGDSDNDSFYSIGLNNYFNGGDGADFISFALQDNDVDLRGLGVHVELDNQFATTGGAREETLINIESVEGTSSDDTLIGAADRNSLYGIGGNDILDGLGGADKLWGGRGNDDLYGSGGADRLLGGRGNDYFEGGAGSDQFIFTSVKDSAAGANRDFIADFHASQNDVIDLSGVDANGGSAGNGTFDFIGGSAFSGTEGELRFKNGIVSGDVDGDGVADFQIRVDATLHQGDFIL